MVLDKLGESLRNTLSKIAKSMFVDEKLVNELVKDIQRALLQSDVNVKLVFELSKRIKEKALKEELPKGLSKKEHLIKVVYDELVVFLGGEGHKIDVKGKPFKIMLVGLFGNGKTTTSGKLAKYFQKRGYKLSMIQLDVWRPAAYEQLKQLGKQLNVPVFGDPKEKDPVKIWNANKKAISDFDIILVDTAGRDALSDELITELADINKLVIPDESLLVLGADVGQAAERQAQAFHDTVNVTGVIITKLDGTAKGGGALTACAVTKAPVKFIGVGEKLDALEEFKPKNFVSRMLGMGDLETLLEKAKESMTEDKAEDLSKRMMKGEFDLIDLQEQMEAMNKMGPLGKVMEMIPGMGQLKMPKDMLKVQEVKLKRWRHIMDSMTMQEKKDPDVISISRIDRISKGSGASVSDVRELLKQYRQSRKMMKMLKGGDQRSMQKMMQKFQGGQMKFK